MPLADTMVRVGTTALESVPRHHHSPQFFVADYPPPFCRPPFFLASQNFYDWEGVGRLFFPARHLVHLKLGIAVDSLIVSLDGPTGKVPLRDGKCPGIVVRGLLGC